MTRRTAPCALSSADRLRRAATPPPCAPSPRASPPAPRRARERGRPALLRRPRRDPLRPLRRRPDAESTCGPRAVLERGAGFCVAKAIVLAAGARAVGIPARLGFADVRNHLTTERLRAQMGTDVFAYHGFTELHLGGRWVKATPTFNRSLCDRFGVKPLEFDGRTRQPAPSLRRRRPASHGVHPRPRHRTSTSRSTTSDAVFAEYYPGMVGGRDRGEGDFEGEAAAERVAGVVHSERGPPRWRRADVPGTHERAVNGISASTQRTRSPARFPAAASSSRPTCRSARRTCRSIGTRRSSSRTPRSTWRCPIVCPETVLPWMDGYIEPALAALGDRVMLLAHYYMGGEIVKLVERYGGHVADSYQLALQTQRHPEVKIFVESAVHFMAESIAILAAPDQDVWITNPKSGCTMEMLAKDHMVEPVFDELQRALRRRAAGDRLHEHVGTREGPRRPDRRRRLHQLEREGRRAAGRSRSGRRSSSCPIAISARSSPAGAACRPRTLFQWPGGLAGAAQTIARDAGGRARHASIRSQHDPVGQLLRRAHRLHAGASRVLAGARLPRAGAPRVPEDRRRRRRRRRLDELSLEGDDSTPSPATSSRSRPRATSCGTRASRARSAASRSSTWPTSRASSSAAWAAAARPCRGTTRRTSSPSSTAAQGRRRPT